MADNTQEKVDQALNKKSVNNCREQIMELVPQLKVAYTDVDGTLVGPHGCFFLDSQHNYTLEPADALLKAHDAGVDVVLVSGRNLSQLLNDSRLLGIKNYIAEMGWQIAYDWGTRVVTPVEAPEGKTIYQEMLDSGAVGLLLNKFEGYLEHHLPWSEDRACTGVFRGKINSADANRVLGEHGFPQLELIDNGRILRKSDTLIVKDLHAYHLVPRGTSKALAVEKDMVVREIRKEETIALGDGEADLEFAPMVGACFMVRNGLLGNSLLAERILETDNVFVTDLDMGLGWAQALNIFTSKRP